MESHRSLWTLSGVTMCVQFQLIGDREVAVWVGELVSVYGNSIRLYHV